jgi:hypothetical protein
VVCRQQKGCVSPDGLGGNDGQQQRLLEAACSSPQLVEGSQLLQQLVAAAEHFVQVARAM